MLQLLALEVRACIPGALVELVCIRIRRLYTVHTDIRYRTLAHHVSCVNYLILRKHYLRFLHSASLTSPQDFPLPLR